MRILSILMILMILGVAVRLGGGWIYPAHLTADNDGYLAHAEMLANGEGFSGPSTHRPTAFRPPVYPIVVAALRVFGLPSAACVAIINGLCSIAIIWLTWVLCRQLQLSQRVSMIATAITAFDPLLVRYTILPMTEVPAAAMLTAAVVALNAVDAVNPLIRPAATFSPDLGGEGKELKVTGGNIQTRRNAIGWLILSGILFGLGSLVRPILLVSCAILVLRRLILCLNGSSDFRRNVAIAILPMVAAAITISPWIIRNAVQFGKFIPATTHGGYTLALGNNPDFYRDVIDGDIPFPWPGPQLDAWQKRMIADAATQSVPSGNEPAQDAWYYQQAIASMKAHPISFFKSCLLRLRRFCAITPGLPDGMPQPVTALIAVWYGLIGIGVFAATVRGIPACRHLLTLDNKGCIPSHHSLADLWLVVLSFMLLHAVYWTDTRMRAPVMPFVCIIAAVGWQSLLTFVSRGICPQRSTDLST